MDLSTDYEFLAAALTAVSGRLCLSSLVPGPNTKIPLPYNAENPWINWSYAGKDFCKLEFISEIMQTWYCPRIPPEPNPEPEQMKMKENPLYIKTLTGKTITIFFKRSSLVFHLKQKIQDMEGIPLDQQRLVGGGAQMKDRLRISDYKIEDDNKIHLFLMLGGPPEPLLLDPKMFDTSKNCDFTWMQDNGQIYKRGNHVYKMPYGWNRIALNVKDNYDDNKWLGDDPGTDNFRVRGLKDEWPVAYHGKPEFFRDMLEDEEAIQGRKSRLEPGFYTAPDPRVAEESAPIFTFKSRKFKVMIQSRVNMNDTSVVRHKKFYVTENPENIRPCGLLIKQVTCACLTQCDCGCLFSKLV